MNDPEYIKNRKYKLKISNVEISDIELANSFLWEENISEKIGASKIDVEALAHALVLGIPIVTDDRNMAVLGKTHDVEVWGILDLLELMCKNEHIDLAMVTAIGDYLFHNEDLPYPSFLKELKKKI